MFIPPFCPNRDCPNHFPGNGDARPWFHRVGSFLTKAHGKTPRFICKCCRKSFSSRTFSPHYWTQIYVDLRTLEECFIAGRGYRQIGRDLNLSYRVIRNRELRIQRGYGELIENEFAYRDSRC